MPVTVILADDHAVFRQGLASLLQTVEGIELLGAAANGREAWDLIERLQPDLAILDIAMPVMTGLEVVRKTTAAGLATLTVLLTACAEPCVVMEALAAGAAGYVLKDGTFEELVMAVQIVIVSGTYLSPTMCTRLGELSQHVRTGSALSPRERDVIHHIAAGKSGKEIARAMGLSEHTIETYRERLMDKLGAHTVADVVRYAVRVGLVD